MTTFTQLNARLKKLFNGLVVGFGPKGMPGECATLCVKSEVMLMGTDQHEFMFESFWHTLLPCRLVIFAAAPAHGSVITFVKRLILVTSV